MMDKQQLKVAVIVGGLTFMVTAIVLFILGLMGMVTLGGLLGYLIGSLDAQQQSFTAQGFQGFEVSKAVFNTEGLFTAVVTNKNEYPIKVIDTSFSNSIDGSRCGCRITPQQVQPRAQAVLTCRGCISRIHEKGEGYRVVVNFKEYLPKNGILRSDDGYIVGQYVE
ncbi:MAG: hypothetical protein GF334_07615 [Candidatus Altiarchaeales archaeon]|nr:hypothetical protein [Candidatus Altiarchaeales archaeon]